MATPPPGPSACNKWRLHALAAAGKSAAPAALLYRKELAKTSFSAVSAASRRVGPSWLSDFS
eukprot:8140606-Pyramimonas_sp.AAC.1